MKYLRLSNPRQLALGLLVLGGISPAVLDPAVSAQVLTAQVSGGRHDALPQSGRISPPGRGIPFGAWSIPTDMLGPLYNGTVLTGVQPYVHLQEIKERKGKVVLYLARNKSRNQGIISVAAVERFLADWPDISPYIKDGTVWGIMVSDDITGKHIWGPDAPYYAQIDSIARLVKERWPGVRTIVRAPVDKMEYPWKWVDWAWVQYSHRYGEVAGYRDRQLALADSLHLCVAFGLNVLNGGDGSSGIKSRKLRAQMTPGEILKYYSALLPYTPVAFHWEYKPGFDDDPAIRAAMEKVRSWADTTVPPTCRYH
jgi:hypothetical protein